MAQLLKVTHIPYESIRFTQNARLIRSDSVDLERRKVLARQNAFRTRYSAGSSVDYNYISRANKAFSAKNHAANELPAVKQEPAQSAAQKPVKVNTSVQTPKPSVSVPAQQPVPETLSGNSSAVSSQVSSNIQASPVQSSVAAEPHASYAAQRGAFELRVAKGELSYVPPLVMTIVTQRPEVHFEYIGGFNYVPPDWNISSGQNMNFTV